MSETNTLATFVSGITDALKDFTTSNLSTILVAALGVAAILVVAWFAYRWLSRKVIGAFKKGKI